MLRYSIFNRIFPIYAPLGALCLYLYHSLAEETRANDQPGAQIALGVIVYAIVIGGFVAVLFVSRRITSVYRSRVRTIRQSAEKFAVSTWSFDQPAFGVGEVSKLESALFAMGDRIQKYRQETNQELLRLRQRMEKCLNNFPHPIFFVNSRRQIVYTNPSAQELSENARWSDGLPKNLITRVESVLGSGEELLATHFDETISFAIDSAVVHYLPLLIRIDSDNIEATECAVILQDITQLRLSDQIKSDLVATVSHEIRTPVTSAMVALHLLLEESIGPTNTEQKDMLRTATSDLNRLKRLLDHLLEIARLEHKAPKLSLQSTSPSALAQNAIEAFATTASDKDISLSAEVEATLPPVLVDPRAIDVALANFLSNAVKYSPASSKVTVYAQRDKAGCLRIGVRDEGPGIDDGELDHVFEKFYRSPNKRQIDGIGLGLSICREIAQAHDGSVGVENRPRGGADFFLLLPIDTKD